MHSLGIVQWNSTRRDHPGNLGGVFGSGPVSPPFFAIWVSSTIGPKGDLFHNPSRGAIPTSHDPPTLLKIDPTQQEKSHHLGSL